MQLYYFFFFFSSRRRHTRLQGDWSSDVCSSDLITDLLAIEEKVDRASRDKVRSQKREIPEGSEEWDRSEEHTSELQSPCNLVCRLLLEKKKYTVRVNMT